MRFCERFNKTLAGVEFCPKTCASIQESNERKMESKRILTTEKFLFITLKLLKQLASLNHSINILISMVQISSKIISFTFDMELFHSKNWDLNLTRAAHE